MDGTKIRLDICSINKLRHEIRHVRELFNDVKPVLDHRIRSVTQGIENFKRNLNEYEKKLKEKGFKTLEERGVDCTSLGAFINSANFGSVLCRPNSHYDVVFDIKGSLIKKCENLLREEEDLMRDCETFNLLKSDLSKSTLEFNNVYSRFCTYSNELNKVTNAIDQRKRFVYNLMILLKRKCFGSIGILMNQIICLEKKKRDLIFFVKKLRFCLEDTVSRLKAILYDSRIFCANQISSNRCTYQKIIVRQLIAN